MTDWLQALCASLSVFHPHFAEQGPKVRRHGMVCQQVPSQENRVALLPHAQILVFPQR
jgi:hypothetical protein